MKIPSEITFETTETNCVCMIVFLCVHVRISISTYILTSIVTYLPYMHTPLQNPKYASNVNMPIVKQNDGTWVEKHQRFYSTFTNFFLNFCHVF